MGGGSHIGWEEVLIHCCTNFIRIIEVWMWRHYPILLVTFLFISSHLIFLVVWIETIFRIVIHLCSLDKKMTNYYSILTKLVKTIKQPLWDKVLSTPTNWEITIGFGVLLGESTLGWNKNITSWQSIFSPLWNKIHWESMEKTCKNKILSIKWVMARCYKIFFHKAIFS